MPKIRMTLLFALTLMMQSPAIARDFDIAVENDCRDLGGDWIEGAKDCIVNFGSTLELPANDSLRISKTLRIEGSLINHGKTIIEQDETSGRGLVVVSKDGFLNNRGSIVVSGCSTNIPGVNTPEKCNVGMHFHGNANNTGSISIGTFAHLIYDATITIEDTGSISNFGFIGTGASGIPPLKGGILDNFGTIVNSNTFVNEGIVHNHHQFTNAGVLTNNDHIDNTETNATFSNFLRIANNTSAVITNSNEAKFDNGRDGRIENHGSILNLSDGHFQNSSDISNQINGVISNIDGGIFLNAPGGFIDNKANFENGGDGSRFRNVARIIIRDGGIFTNKETAVVDNARYFGIWEDGQLVNQTSAEFFNNDYLEQDGEFRNEQTASFHIAPSAVMRNACNAVTWTSPGNSFFQNFGRIEASVGSRLPPVTQMTPLSSANGLVVTVVDQACLPNLSCGRADPCPQGLRCAKRGLKPSECVVPCSTNADCFGPMSCDTPPLAKFARCM